MNSFHRLLPFKRDVIQWDEIVNALGYQPDLRATVKFLERKGFYLCTGQVFKRASAIIQRSGRPPSEEERTHRYQPERKTRE